MASKKELDSSKVFISQEKASGTRREQAESLGSGKKNAPSPEKASPQTGRQEENRHRKQEFMNSSQSLYPPHRFEQLRRRTLIRLRWLAILGQTITILTVYFLFNFPLPLFACLATIGLSIAVNTLLSILYKPQKFAREKESVAQLAFDILQLSILFLFTGGLSNPFIMLLSGPVIVGATGLRPRYGVFLATLALLSTLILAFFSQPLPWENKEGLSLPALYQAGLWIALVITTAFTMAYARRMAQEAQQMSKALSATENVLAKEQKLYALGGLAAAAAHELGTPLATIHLTAHEMSQHFSRDSLLYEDALLLISQSHRCREILKQLSQRGESDDEIHARIELFALLNEVIAPYKNLGIKIIIRLVASPEVEDNLPPTLRRIPEVLYGLRNFVENAVNHAVKTVTLTASWDPHELRIDIVDDGSGFSQSVLSVLGEPYIGNPKGKSRRPKGLGLGIFIAMTLLERISGRIRFENSFKGGAVVSISWKLKNIQFFSKNKTEKTESLSQIKNRKGTAETDSRRDSSFKKQ